MIYILKQTNETLNTFAHYFKSLEVKQIGAQESKPPQKRTQDIEPENKPEVKQEAGHSGLIEKICKNCGETFFAGNIRKETCSDKCRSEFSKKKKKEGIV